MGIRWYGVLVLVLTCVSTGVVAADDIVRDAGFSSELVFPLNSEHNHAPGIAELENGDLIVSWYRGAGERKADDVRVLGARKPAGSSEWSSEFLMADTPGFPDCNTCLMVDSKNRLWLFWPVILANTWESCITRYKVSEHPIGTGSPRWSSEGMILMKPEDFSAEGIAALDRTVGLVPQLLSEDVRKKVEIAKTQMQDKLYQRLGWQPRCKPTVLPSGRILLPLYTDTFSIGIMAISDDGGETWYSGKPMFGFGAIQPTVLWRTDGTVVAYLRENGFTGRVRVCESKDEGMSWGEVGTIEIPNPGSGLDGVRLKNGHWLLVCNDTAENRNRLTVYRSTDEGRTWSLGRTLEDQPEGSYHYPAMIQTRDERIHVVYSYFVEGGKSMKHCSFEESWLESGR